MATDLIASCDICKWKPDSPIPGMAYYVYIFGSDQLACFACATNLSYRTDGQLEMRRRASAKMFVAIESMAKLAEGAKWAEKAKR